MGLFSTEEDTSQTPRTDNLMGNLMGYLDTRIDILRLEAQEKAKTTFVSVMHGVAMAVIGLLFFVFLNLFVALLLNDVLDSPYWGFGIVAAFYLAVLIVFIVGVDKKAFQGLADKLLNDTIYKSDKRQA
ncbi:phage holin family protein [Hymenobacter rubripertinctus]|uniref:Phage holin family protein n=1 Tax=Hymenobacter rubripertinctus TaxID=2029981 RepID=A0A418QRX9_9BACT|nr:phage holin family protein [Hymenobacter rubripertinctus]RIY07976.1 phage holin family protein [Hymenobacter rubripertinctus]